MSDDQMIRLVEYLYRITTALETLAKASNDQFKPGLLDSRPFPKSKPPSPPEQK
jgi:hypothetical protein